MNEYQKIINNLTEKRNDLLEIVTTIQSDYSKGLFHILFLNELNIKGELLEKFHYVCCEGDQLKTILTLNMLEAGIFDLYDILKNIYSKEPIPFFNSDINNVENPFDPTFYNNLKKQHLFCNLQKNDFRKRLKDKLKNEKIV